MNTSTTEEHHNEKISRLDIGKHRSRRDVVRVTCNGKG
jgi:hypothetical protein